MTSDLDSQPGPIGAGLMVQVALSRSAARARSVFLRVATSPVHNNDQTPYKNTKSSFLQLYTAMYVCDVPSVMSLVKPVPARSPGVPDLLAERFYFTLGNRGSRLGFDRGGLEGRVVLTGGFGNI